jgi:hypothetical protein
MSDASTKRKHPTAGRLRRCRESVQVRFSCPHLDRNGNLVLQRRKRAGGSDLQAPTEEIQTLEFAMKTILQGVAALSLALALSGAAPAGYRYFVHYSGPAYHLTYGVRFSHGYYFRGPAWHQFTYRWWSPRFHSYVYWYPGTRTWYYWSGPRAIYYPVSYATVLPPGGEVPAGTDALPNTLPSDVAPPQ